ncbi:potassium-transporting ATPase subunit KdpC [Cohnella sp. 56]|uniref:potassium-transporting ATPase subunit KdpC n=1 Tax=Cohnella sp. 56 TaxID=3113722 RepID=UPI0030E928F7
MKNAAVAIRISAVLMALCGLIYPLAATGLAQLLAPGQAAGSLIRSEDGQVVGSALLAQAVESPGRFHPRESAAKYDPTASVGSNRAVASQAYAEEIAAKVQALRAGNPGLRDIPADLVTGSGSGLDPDLSPAAAKAQIPGISRETGIPEAQLAQLVDAQTKGRQLGLFGEPRVNVTALNMALAQLAPGGEQ